MDSFLKDKGIHYQIIVTEQRDDRPFNRGQLFNAVFDLIKDDFDYFCFHDINLLPVDDNCDYSYPEKPTHLASIVDDEYIPYEEFIGGVFLINKEHFEQINGFSNEYWGWGYEDNDLLERMRSKNLPLNNSFDISSATKNERYSFNQVYLHNTLVKKPINAIHFENSTCMEIKPTDLINDLTSKSFSFSIWANPKQEDYEQFILTRPPIGFGITYTVNGKFKFTVWDDNDTAHVIEDYRILNEWYHLCMTYDKDTKEFKAYINGSLIGTKKVETLKDLVGQWFYIGADSEWFQLDAKWTLMKKYFTGGISETTFWNVSLSQDEVRVLYLENVEDLIYDPILFYRYDKGYGTFILDETTHEHNAIFKTNFKEPPLSSEHMPLDLPFGSTERIAVIGSRVKTVGKKFINQTKGKITLGHPIKIPNKRFGVYKSLNDENELSYKENIHRQLESYDPDILKNGDIFFDEVRLDLLDTDTIGLNNLSYKLGSRKEYEGIHEWLEIIT
jgi:hypothetical protein